MRVRGARGGGWEDAGGCTGDGGVPVPLTGAEAARAVAEEGALRGCSDLHGR